ncbi:DNA-directed RNA polymerase specialized sigma subunit, sigma24 family [Chitinophaga eiseniae]|uniref:DNA-directed RNA polymerase specialized sigma subunit, sigma24 family n=1 Tax=Chitinophaga eiseniae TaxID=634771 RepID=A0A1T4NAR3_9BACT|nr:sigma-70 family RNA polymerase sigma factor [Chitinophaga eiseniae]SJZ76163.1 DNA-directed RNA polymerase specialized sigma subunit, sigma24 family [Chitinophaga eiseniae]
MTDNALPSERDNHAHQYFLLFREGNERGFSFIYNHLYRPVFSFARSIIKDEFEITTIIQNAFKLIWDRRNMMENIEHIKNFICKRVKWDCLTYISNSKNNFISLEQLSDQGIQLAVYDPYREASHQEQLMTDEVNLNLIRKAAGYLSKSRIELIDLLLQGYSHQQIAAVTGHTIRHIAVEVKKCIAAIHPYIKRTNEALDMSNLPPIIRVDDYQIYLTHSQTNILKLFYEKGYTFHEIGDELNMTKTKVIAAYQAALKTIRSCRRT